MKAYNNIEKNNTLDDESMNIIMKNGKKAVAEFIRLNKKFQAAIYSLFTPQFEIKEEEEEIKEHK